MAMSEEIGLFGLEDFNDDAPEDDALSDTPNDAPSNEELIRDALSSPADEFVFVAWIKGNIVYKADGDIEFKVAVPGKFRENVKDLWRAIATPMLVAMRRFE